MRQQPNRNTFAHEGVIPITLKSNRNSTIEAALTRAVATFSNSVAGDFRDFLRKILIENQILLDGNSVKVTYVRFPRCITPRQMEAALNRITALHLPVDFAHPPLWIGGCLSLSDSNVI